MASFSSRSNRFWRSISSVKSTLWPSKSGPSTQANRICPSTVTRHEPHMPVPSTMIEFRLTIVFTPRGRVTSQQARIMTSGPIATASFASGCFSSTFSRAAVTSPFIPKEPSSVVTWNSSL